MLKHIKSFIKLGVYISKATYARAGEQSLDNFYRPWHLVEYYRYLRFFSNGTVLFLTTPNEPLITVSKLKSRSINNSTVNSNYYTSFVLNEQSILNGTWTLTSSNRVQITLLKKTAKTTNKIPRRQAFLNTFVVDQEQAFRLVR